MQRLIIQCVWPYKLKFFVCGEPESYFHQQVQCIHTVYIHPEKYMKIVKTMSNFCIKNISLAVMMEKMMELSANSNCIFFFFSKVRGPEWFGIQKAKQNKTFNQLLTSHLAQLIFLVSNYQKMLQSNNWKMIRGRLLGELRYKNMAVCRKWFDKGYYE